jgi:vesicle coat complex subunit
MAAAASAASAAAARIGSALSDANYFESGMVRVDDIRRLLDSRSLKDKLDAMKRVVALISLGRDASVFFPDVVKNVVAPSLDVKKLVYLYLVHYAEDKQDLALLSINSFQKDISDPNQLIRALALRVLSSIRVKVILQIVILAITKCANDPSPYVRKTAAHAICKVCSLDAPSFDLLLDPLIALLNDRSLDVLGSAVAVFEEVAPNRFDLIHPHFRHICRSLADIDPYGQVAVLRLLLRYGRTQFADAQRIDTRDSDLSFLLTSVHPLLLSRNPSVTVAVISIYYHLASLDELRTYVTLPLMRLVSKSDQGVQLVALRAAEDIVTRAPGALLSYMSELFISATDGAPVRDQKLIVLTRFCETAAHPSGLSSNSNARHALLMELKSYLYRADKILAVSATRAMGCLAAAHPPSMSAVISLLASVVAGSANAVVVSESVTVLRRLLQLHPSAQARALPKLLALLLIPQARDTAIEAPQARAAIVWLIGESYEKAPHVAPEALRLLALTFCDEHSDVKVQVLNLAAKVVAWRLLDRKSSLETNPVSMMTRMHLLNYLTSIAEYDANYDVRDKARLLSKLFLMPDSTTGLQGVGLSAQARAACQALLDNGSMQESNKPSACHDGKDIAWPLLPSETKLAASDIVLGSMSHALACRLGACGTLPSLAASNTPSSLREEGTAPRIGGGVLEIASISSADFRGGGVYARGESIGVGHMTSISSASIARLDDVGAAGGNAERSVLGPWPVSGRSGGRPVPHITAERFYDSESSADSDSGSYETETDSNSDDADRHHSPVAPRRHAHPGTVPTTQNVALELQAQAPLSYADPALGRETLAPAVSRLNGSQNNRRLCINGSSHFPDADELFAALSLPQLGNQAQRGACDSDALTASLTSLSLLPPASTHQTRTGKAFRRLIDSWNGGGVELDVMFAYAAVDAGRNSTHLMLRVTNCGKTERLDVELKPESPSLVLATPPGDSDSHCLLLAPGQTAEVKGYGMFSGKVSAIKIAIVSLGAELGCGDIRPTVGEVLMPSPAMTQAEFDAKKKKLSGMFGSTTKLSLPMTLETPVSRVIRAARATVLRDTFLAEVGFAMNPASALDSSSLSFAGFLPSSTSDGKQISERCDVLVQLRIDSRTLAANSHLGAVNGSPGGLGCHLWVGCDNVVFSNQLGQLLCCSLKNCKE